MRRMLIAGLIVLSGCSAPEPVLECNGPALPEVGSVDARVFRQRDGRCSLIFSIYISPKSSASDVVILDERICQETGR